MTKASDGKKNDKQNNNQKDKLNGNVDDLLKKRSAYAIIESQQAIITVLMTAIRLYRDNESLDDEYLELVTKGLADADPERSDTVLRKKEKNSAKIRKLLRDIDPL